MKSYTQSNLRQWSALGALVSCLLGAASGHAATLYVATDSPADGPGTTWATAFHTIQGAVNVATNGDTVRVTNGVYASGGALTPGYSLSNRVCLTKAITLQSVNGPAYTLIVGAADPASTNGPAAVRCVYLVTNAVVSGFTLTNGNTTTTDNYNYNGSGGGAFLDHGGTVSNCVLTGCSSYGPGSGAYLYHAGTVNNCAFTGNAGGAQSGGGGAYLNQGGTLNNCLLSGNSTFYRGGGAYCNEGGTLNNCTVVGNRVKYYDGGGVYCANSGTLNNCIVYSNTPGGNNNIWGLYTARYTCAPGLSGNGCITNDPQFVNAPAGNYRLAGTSPCVNTGTNGAWTTGMTDLDGNPRTFGGKADMGAYELVASAVTYVAPGGSNVWPYATWAKAATTIQAAVDAVTTGGMVLVSNGVYSTGGSVTPGYSLSNRVSITKAITLQSVNGAASTFIVGAAHPTTTNGTTAMRCVWMNAGALVGFTLTNGHTFATGGNWNHDVAGGGLNLSGSATASNCVITGCSAAHGGGVKFVGAGTLEKSTVQNCRSDGQGGGLYFNVGGTASRCIVRNNRTSSDGGGGAYLYGGGLARSSLFAQNTAAGSGGGALMDTGGLLENCTVVSNTCPGSGGGVYVWQSGTNLNTILQYNTATGATSNYTAGASGVFRYCCTTPLVTGTGNIIAAPLFVGGGDYRLQTGSPCINTGTNQSWMSTATDLAGLPRVLDTYADMGAYEYAGAPAVDITTANATVSNATTNYTIAGTVNSWVVGTLVWTNSAAAVGGALSSSSPWSIAGIALAHGPNPITVMGTNIVGTTASDTVTITRDPNAGPGSPTHYVWLDSPAPAWPYTNWASAAHTIQDAVDTADTGDTVLVGNGVYATGGAPNGSPAMSNRVCITNDITVQSVDGPSVTVIKGAPDAATGGLGTNATRCVFMSAGFLTGFTLTNGYTRTDGDWNTQQGGGGALVTGGSISNCVVTGCKAAHFGGGLVLYGGAAWNCAVTGNTGYDGGGILLYGAAAAANCLLRDNRASNRGGGVFFWQGGTLGSCTVAGNSATNAGGGAYFYQGGVSRNSIIYFNTTNGVANNWTTNGSGTSFVSNCTTPALPGDLGIVTDDPRLMNLAAGDCRLKPGSPCIDDATDYYVAGANDLAGNPRMINYWSDIGAYEYTFPALTMTNSVTTVATNQESIVLGGTSAYLTGLITYANAANGASGSLPAQAVWTTPEIPLLYGPNQINVTGTNYGGAVASSSITITRQSPPAPFVDLTNQAATVVYAVTSYSIGGTNNAYVVGTMWWTNRATSASGTFAAHSPWEVTGIALAVGANSITVTGTNYIGVAAASTVTITRSIAPAPFVDITNLASSVVYTVTNFSIGGTNNAAVVGMMRWTNSATSASGTFAASSPWQVTGIALVLGANVITVYGTNVTGVVSSDSVVITGTLPLTTYVALGGSNVPPYETWANAATTIQEAVDMTAPGGTVWVSNGVYATGGKVTPGRTLFNRVCLTTDITVQSLNGPTNTIIVGAGPRGAGGVRGAYLSAGVLSGFTLTNGNTLISGTWPYDRSGGGALLNKGGTLSNCIVTGSSATDGGGGVFLELAGTLNDSTIRGNTTSGGTEQAGGGGVVCSAGGTVNRCLISGNRATKSTAGGGMGGGVWLDNGGILNSCIISNNSASANGGGGVHLAGGGRLNNSTICRNTTAGGGGGVQLENNGGAANNCLVYANTAGDRGGGAFLNGGGVMNNCTLAGNTSTFASSDGGGAWLNDGGTLNNCIVSGNTQDGTRDIAVSGAGTTVRSTCSPGLSGSGNLTNAPLFMDAAANNYRLLAGSPCIDAGSNTYLPAGPDLDGTPRPLDGLATGTAIVDMGCYEFLNSASDSDGDGIPDGWELAHGLNPLVNDAANNPDGDAFNNGQEYLADTDPNDAASYFHLTGVANLPPWTVTFGSSASRVYTLYRQTNLTDGAWLAVPGQSNVVGTGGSLSLTDTNAAAASFYRVKVALP